MAEVLTKAAGFMVMILIGYVMKKLGVFTLSDSRFLSKLIMRVTLPAAVIMGFQGFDINPTLIFVILFGIGTNIIMVLVALLVTRKREPKEKAFYMINTSSYNIGTFTIPFTQTFFSSAELAVVYMFDVGNAIMSLGTTFAFAYSIAHGEKTISVKAILKQLSSSVALNVYIAMFLLSLFHIKLPESMTTIISMIGSANGFLAMIMIGIIFEVKLQRRSVNAIFKVICLRYGGALLFSILTYFLLPLPLMLRQMLVLIYFSPILSIAPVYAAKCGCIESAAAVLNSLCIPISMACMTGILILFLL